MYNHRPAVYLAGPVAGVLVKKRGAADLAELEGWRQQAMDYFDTHGIFGLSPLRKISEFSGFATPPEDQLQKALCSQRGIYHRDFYDCTTVADLVLVNFLGTVTPSIGTIMEIAWAAHKRIPIVVVMEKEGNPHEHSMIREACPFRVETLEEGMKVAVAILAPSPKA
jgi:hypothetical protein